MERDWCWNLVTEPRLVTSKNIIIVAFCTRVCLFTEQRVWVCPLCWVELPRCTLVPDALNREMFKIPFSFLSLYFIWFLLFPRVLPHL